MRKNRNQTKKKITYERIKYLFDYDEERGVLINKVKRCSVSMPGMVAGLASLCTNGYYQFNVDGGYYYTHHIIFVWNHGYYPEQCIDHIDRNRKNNKIENLREVSHQCNARNCNISKNNKSGVTGVYWDKSRNKWSARITDNYKDIYLGRYKIFKDAVKARFEAEKKYGFQNCDSTSTAYLYLKNI